MITKHWIFGSGTGSFSGEYKKIFCYHITRNPHNQYIFTLVELGLPGLFALLFIIYALWKFSYSLPKLEKNLLQGVIATIFIGSLANSWLNDFTSMYFLVTMAGVLMAARSDLPTHISHPDQIN